MYKGFVNAWTFGDIDSGDSMQKKAIQPTGGDHATDIIDTVLDTKEEDITSDL